MSEVINTNMMSLVAQNNLNTSQSQLATAMQRLSSGLRINSSADDAAGYAIATAMTTQIQGLNTAAQNANDGISLAQTASAALQQITSNLQSIRQLAVESANATNSSGDRADLNAEVQQKLAEITRVATQTNFNGRNILDGTFGNAAFQVGANVGQTISINLSQGVKANQMGAIAEVTGTTAFAQGLTIGTGGLTVKIGTGNAKNVAAGTYTSLQSVADAINAAAIQSGATSNIASVNSTTGELAIAASTGTNVTFGGTVAGTAATAAAGTLGLGKTALTAATNTTGAPAAVGSIVLAAGDPTLQSGTSAVTDVMGGGSTPVIYNSVQDLADAINGLGLGGVSAWVNSSNQLQLAAQNGLTIGGTASGDAGLTNGSIATNGTLANVNVNTVGAANDTMLRIDAALTTVSNLSSELGAMQNRFTSAVSSAQAVSQNLTASRSRIQDADFAKETAAMSQAQILQQAGISVLAQANAQPQLVLKLLP